MLDPEKIGVKEIRNESGDVISLEARVVSTATIYLSPNESGRGLVLDYAKPQLRRRIWEDLYGDLREDIYAISVLVKEPSAADLILKLTKKLSPKF